MEIWTPLSFKPCIEPEEHLTRVSSTTHTIIWHIWQKINTPRKEEGRRRAVNCPPGPFPPLCFIMKSLSTTPRLFHSAGENVRDPPVLSVNISISGPPPPPPPSRANTEPATCPLPQPEPLHKGRKLALPTLTEVKPQRREEKGVALDPSTDRRKHSEETARSGASVFH